MSENRTIYACILFIENVQTILFTSNSFSPIIYKIKTVANTIKSTIVKVDIYLLQYGEIEFTVKIIKLFYVLDESHFQKLSEEISNDFDFHWNSEPKSIGKYIYQLVYICNQIVLALDK